MDYEPVNFDRNSDLLERIKRFEAELSAELGENVSIVAYHPHTEATDNDETVL